jgi:hypothetical protein
MYLTYMPFKKLLQQRWPLNHATHAPVNLQNSCAGCNRPGYSE